MDIKNEDTMVKQIEKNLSDNINENLYAKNGTTDSNQPLFQKHYRTEQLVDTYQEEEANPYYPLISTDYISGNSTRVSRAEYIRQAREACLRQLSSIQIYSRPYDVNYIEPEPVPEDIEPKKTKGMKLFHNTEVSEKILPEHNSKQDSISIRFLIIRSICAILLFLCVFAFDKMEWQIGSFTHHTIQEYVTGNDALRGLENFILAWLK